MVHRHHAATTRMITEVNVPATVGMSVTVGEIICNSEGNVRTVGECPQQWGDMSATVGKLNMV